MLATCEVAEARLAAFELAWLDGILMSRTCAGERAEGGGHAAVQLALTHASWPLHAFTCEPVGR